MVFVLCVQKSDKIRTRITITLQLHIPRQLQQINAVTLSEYAHIQYRCNAETVLMTHI